MQAIKTRKFVDLSDLLPEALRETQFDRASDKEDSKAKRKYTISTRWNGWWLSQHSWQ